MKITVKQAEKLIALARKAISAYFDDKEIVISDELKKEFKEVVGVFINLYVDNELIGSMGYPEPINPLAESVAAIARIAAFEDPRFPPLKEEQMKDLRIELLISTSPKLIEVATPLEYFKKIRIGQDGLMIRDEFGTGVLMPQVAVKWRWDAKEFLKHTCRKAGLKPDCWDNTKRNVYKFQAQMFSEEKGKVIEKKL